MIIDVKKYVEERKLHLKDKVNELKNKPKLVVISVGDDPASKVYVRNKGRVAEEIGLDFEHIHFEDGTFHSVIGHKITELNHDVNVSGIIVQLPLPKGYDEEMILNFVREDKDVDGLTLSQRNLLEVKNTNKFIPCTPLGIMNLIDHLGYKLEGKNVIVIGRSELVGKPVAKLMLERNATVTICHSRTKFEDLLEHCRNADVIVSAVGVRGLVTPKHIGLFKNPLIIDVGINRDEEGKLCGDVDRSVYTMSTMTTPVPAGVGLTTVISLMENTIKAYKIQRHLE